MRKHGVPMPGEIRQMTMREIRLTRLDRGMKVSITEEGSVSFARDRPHGHRITYTEKELANAKKRIKAYWSGELPYVASEYS